MKVTIPPLSFILVIFIAAIGYNSSTRTEGSDVIDNALISAVVLPENSVSEAQQLMAPKGASVDLSEVQARPVFDPDRGKALEAPPEVPPLSNNQPETEEEIEVADQVVFPFAKYIGYTVLDGGVSALLLKNDSEEIWVSVGDEFETWRVISISLSEDGFKTGDQTEILKRSF